MYGYNSELECWWWNCDEFSDKRNGTCRIWGVEGQEVVLSIDNVLFTYDMENYCISKELIVPQIMNGQGTIAYVREIGDEIYVLLEENTPTVYSWAEDKSHQILYKTTPDYSDICLVKDYKKNGNLIYLDENEIVDYDGRCIHLYEMDDGQIGEEKASYRLKDKIKSRGYYVDVAGEWLFIKHYNIKKDETKLIEKIHLWEGQ